LPEVEPNRFGWRDYPQDGNHRTDLLLLEKYEKTLQYKRELLD
jgi:hypothetical protein